MRIKIITVFSAMVLFMSGCASAPKVNQSTDSSSVQLEWLTNLSGKLSKGIVGSGTKKIASLDFVDLQGRPTELGRYLSEQLSVEMVNEKGISVVDRANFRSILAEHKLTMDGLVDPETAKQLGKFAGIDAILTGTVTTLDGNIVLTVKAISTETAQIIAAAKAIFRSTTELQQLSMRFASAEVIGAAPAASLVAAPVDTNAAAKAVYSDPTAIAIKDMGDLKIVLKTIRPVTTANDAQGIQWVFEFVNTNPKDSVLVANASVKDWGEDKSKSKVIDSTGQTWKINQLSGLSYVGASGVVNVEEIMRSVMTRKHLNPNGVSYNGEWTGGFMEIPAAQSKRVTMLFAQSGNFNNSGSIKLADPFQFECDLIKCTGATEKPDNCSSATVMFDDISLPKAK